MKYLMMIILMLAPAITQGQHHHQQGEMKPATLIPGMGDVNQPVSTTNVEAQKFFNQGLACIYGFNHEEAVRSFRRAAELDPRLAMAYWGVALALGSNYNLQAGAPQLKEAYANVQKAVELSANATELERDYILALAKRYSNDPQADLKKLAVDYKTAMGELVKRYPDDLDAATLYAESMMNLRPWQLWTADGKPAENTEEILATLEGVLKRDPDHPGANHYYIHAIEASPNPERGLASAARLEKLAPASGHLVHMPSHIYVRTGDYDKAASSNADAIVADRAYIEKRGAAGVYPMMYYNHNIHFLASAHAMNGRYRDAIKTARELESSIKPHIKAMPMLEMFMPYTTVTLVRFRQWDEVLKSPEPDTELKITGAIWHFARGMAYAANSQTTNAEAEMRKLQEKIKAVPADAGLGQSSALAVLKIAENLLAGKIAFARGDKQTAIEMMSKAVEAEDAINYNEPPDWDLPVREWLGGALLMTGDNAEAEKVFRQELKKHPRNGRALFGLVESLKRQEKLSAARLVRREFERAWKNADTQLSVEQLFGTTGKQNVDETGGARPMRFGDVRLKTGVRLRYAEQGDPKAHPLILLHGYTDSSFSFSLVMPSLAANYHVYALDFRGHGDSERPASGYNPSDFARDVLAFMDAKQLKRATVIGHSMGGFIAQLVAASAPDRVTRLVLIGTATTPRTQAVTEFAPEVRKLKGTVPVEFARDFQASTVYQPVASEFLDRVVRESLKVPAFVWRATFEGLIGGDAKADPGRIKAPTLIIWGDRDAYFPREGQQVLATSIRNSVLKVYPETGHAPQWERPEAVVRDINEFLARTESQ